MSKKNNSKLLTYSFLLLIVSIGFPFSSTFSDTTGRGFGIVTDVTFESDYQIINFFLGKGMVGESIFDFNNQAYAQTGESPIIILDGADPQHIVLGSGYTELGAIAHDIKDGDLTGSIVINSTEFVDAIGSYTIYYDVTDSDSNSVQQTRTVNVGNTANTIPVINLNGSSTINISLGFGYVEFGATASDTEDGDLTGSIVINSTEFIDLEGTYSVYYDVTDSDSNSVQEIRTVNVNKIFTNSTDAIYETQDEADLINNVIVGRTESSDTQQTGERTFVTSTGLTKWIQDNQGVYVERLINEDSSGIAFESGTFTYFYDKSSCGMTVYDIGRMTVDSKQLIKYNGWIAKSALNGTDNWTDLPQNNLPCVVTVVDDVDGTVITAVREDSNGKFTETYDIPKPLKDLKTTLTFFNNDTALNDHKIAFTNILDATPEHYRFLLKLTEIADVDPLDMYDPIEIPYFKGYTTSPATVPMMYSNNCDIPVNSTLNDRYDDCTTFIGNGNFTDISRDDFHISMYVNATENGSPTVMTDNGFAMDYFSDEYETWIPLRYEFTNDAVDKLWNVRIVNNQPLQNRIFIDYMNISNITSVGQTATLDPSITSSLAEVDIHKVTSSSGTFFGAGTRCTNTPSLAFGTDFSWSTTYVGGMIGGRFTICTVPMLTFDLTVIPDEASILQMDFSYNVTSTAMPNDANMRNRWIAGFAEDVRTFSGTDAGLTIFRDFVGGTTSAVNTFGGVFNMPTFSTSAGTTPCAINPVTIAQPCIMSITLVDPTTLTDNIETQIESGQNFMLLNGCNYNVFDEATTAQGRCDHGDPSSSTFSTTWIGDESTILLDITWEIFLPSTAPQNLTCVATSPTDLFLDWNPPLDSGGTPITGYQIDRSTGASFIPLATVGVSPSSFTDTTAFAGVLFSYQVSAINDQGTGAVAEISCGIAGISGDPILVTLTNIGVGIVALDWVAPLFTGNDVVTGYKIERTIGTPNTNDEWQFIQHKRESVDTVSQGDGVRILDVGDPTGFLRLQGVGDTTVEGVMLSSNINSGRIGNTYLFKDFAKEDIINRSIEWRWDQFKKAAGFSLQTFGEWETRSYIADGVFDMTGANTVGGSGDFPAEVAGTFSGSLHVPSVGNGIVYDCFDNVAENAPTSITLGSTPTDTTLPTTSQMEGANQHQVTCVVDDLSSASQDRVTVILMIDDRQTGLIGCGSNCASHEIGSIVVDFIDIVGLGDWDFVNDIPIGTVITFDPPSSNDNGFGILNTNVVGEFDILKFVIGDGFITLVADTGNTNTEFLDTTVEESTNYGYRVSAINAQGISDPSNVVAILTAGAPSPPVITVTATGTTSINIDWTTPDLNEGILVEYELERKLGTGGFFTTLDTTTDTEFDDGTGLFALQSDTEYCYHVKTITNVGESSFSVEQCATTFDAPSEVENLVVTALDGSSVNMSFDDPLSDGGSPITGFQIEQKIGAGAFQIVQVSNLFNQVRNDTGFPIGTLITYKVTAFNQFGGGDQAQASDTTDATPQAPPNFSCSATSSTSLTLNWDTPQTFTIPTGYLIDRRTVGGVFSTLVANTADTATFFVDDGLAVDSIFQYRILAHTPEGDTDFTPTITCSTLGAPDFPPENLQGDFTQTIPHQMVLAWDIPDTFGVPINSFRIERDDGAGFFTLATVSGSTFLFIDQDPDNAISQKYRIFTVGSEGDSPPSIAIPFSANQTSHWHYEKTIDDTGENKNAGAITGTANFNNTGQVGLGHTFDGSTYITVDNESDYDHDKDVSFGITTYFKGGGGNVTSITDDWHWAFMINDAPSVSNEVTHDTTKTNLNHLVGGFTQGTTWFFKTFDKNEIDGKDFKITWQGTGTIHRALVKMYDGEYLPSAGLADFPPKAGCNGCAEFDPVLKDSGKLQFSTTRVSAFTLTTETSFTIDTSGSTNANDKVTIFVYYQDKESAAVSTGSIGIDKIEIQNLGIWDFGTNVGATLLGNTPVTCATFSPLNADSCGTNNASTSISIALQALVTKATTTATTGFKLFIDPAGLVGFKLTNTESTNEISVIGTTNVYDDVLHFIGAGYNGNGTASGVSLMVDGVFETKTILFDNLSASILNNESLTIGATSSGGDLLVGLLDETRFFGSGTLDDATLQAIAEDSITTVIPIVATITIAGSTFADISSETPLIIMTSGYPLPTIGTIDLQNFTATTVNSQAVGLVIDGVSGEFTLDPSLFNIMGSLSNYTATVSLTNSEETLPILSNFDLQTPLFTFTGDFFFQQQRNPTFDILSFNYTQTIIPFDLDCNIKSTLFDNGTTVEFDDVFFVQLLQPVPQLEDVVVACIDPNQPIVDPTAPSFGGINTILSFVSFGDTTGIGNFLQFTNNYGDFFGVGLPFLFVIILAAAFTGRSAPTGILIIAIAIGIMAALGILEVDPFMWGIIVVLVILGVLGGKKFL